MKQTAIVLKADQRGSPPIPNGIDVVIGHAQEERNQDGRRQEKRQVRKNGTEEKGRRFNATPPLELASPRPPDKQSSRIQVFDLQGNFLRSFGGPVIKIGGGMMGFGTPTWDWEGKFVGVQSLAFDQNGMLHALDAYQDKVQIHHPVTGAYQSFYNAFLVDTGAHLQLDIDINSEGKVIMTDVSSRSVEHIYTVTTVQ